MNRSPARIAFITNNTCSVWAGSDELWSLAALHLARSGVPVLVCVQNWRPQHSRITELQAAGATIHVIRPKRAARLREKLHALLRGGAARDLPLVTVDEAVVRFRPDLVVISQMQNYDGAHWARACRARSLPYALVAQAASEFAWPQDWIWADAREGHLKAARSFFVSRRNVELTERQFGFTLSNAEVVCNPFLVAFDQPASWPADDGKFRLACVARLEPPAKGHDLLLQVLAQPRWRPRPLSLSLFGSGTHGDSVRALAEHLHLADVVSFRGHASDIATVWRTHHGLVLASRSEGTPLALYEAMLCHRLAVVTDVGGNAELVEDNLSGFVAATPSFSALDEALERAWERRAGWREIGLAAGRRVRNLAPANPARISPIALWLSRRFANRCRTRASRRHVMPLIPARLRTWIWGGRELTRLGRPDVAFAFLGGLGDELLCTVPLVEWRQRGARNVWVRTRKPELFAGFDHDTHILPDDPRYDRLAARVGRPFRYLAYSHYDPVRDRDEPPARHVIAEMCARAGLRGSVALRPHWRVTELERAAAERWHDHVAIRTSTLTAHVPMHNKQWPVERFQAVVDRLSPAVKFVQIGSPADPGLRGVVDLRGQTSLRQTAALLHQARAFVGLVGFLMHVARAVECPGVIVYGGRETPAISGYSCNINLVNVPTCAPCWQRSRCDFERVCLDRIPGSAVVAATEEMLSRQKSTLAVDHAEI